MLAADRLGRNSELAAFGSTNRDGSFKRDALDLRLPTNNVEVHFAGHVGGTCAGAREGAEVVCSGPDEPLYPCI